MASKKWRLADSLKQLRDQVNELAPERSKVADGTIGDAAHASRSSDHNPWVWDAATKSWVVTGMDITHDPADGLDSYALAESIRAAQNQRVKYVISNGRIFSGSEQDKPAWIWRDYDGANSHSHHVHISVKSDKANYDDTTEWRFPGYMSNVVITHGPDPILKLPLLVNGTKGKDVENAQRLLVKAGYPLDPDGWFGDKTEKAVMAFQRARKMPVDGKIGVYTWRALMGV